MIGIFESRKRSVSPEPPISLFPGEQFLSAYYRLNDTEGAIVDTINGINGTNNGCDRPGSYYYFDGVSDNITFPDNDAFSFVGANGDIPCSIRLLVNFSRSGADEILLNKIGGSNNREWYIYNFKNKLIWRLYSGGTTTNYIEKTLNITPTIGALNEIICTYDGSGTHLGMDLSFNTVKATTGAVSGTYSGMQNGNNVVMAGQYSGGANILFFKGTQEHIAFWKNYVLTEEDKLFLYNDGDFTKL